ncbi:MAG: hypothetical protein RXR09_02955 [Acidilobus sp.]
MSESWELAASQLLERARSLKGDLREAFIYLLDNVSVGDLRAALDLKRKGLQDPVGTLERLVEMGLAEKGSESYNLPWPIRRLIAERGVGVAERALGVGPG